MWHVPAVQFIMDDTIRQVREVEELLAVADMGPDFEPTLVGNSLTSQLRPAREQKATHSSYQSDVNMSEVPGPGGSVELVTSLTGYHKQSFTQHSETWNNVGKSTWLLRTQEDLTSEKLDREKIGCDDVISVDELAAAAQNSTENESHHCRDKNSKAEDAEPDMCSDICGVDHARLWRQVLLAKRKSVNRSYRLSDELIAHYSAAADSSKTVSTRDRLARSKMRKRNKNGEVCHNPDYLLSCHYHNHVED